MELQNPLHRIGVQPAGSPPSPVVGVPTSTAFRFQTWFKCDSNISLPSHRLITIKINDKWKRRCCKSRCSGVFFTLATFPVVALLLCTPHSALEEAFNEITLRTSRSTFFINKKVILTHLLAFGVWTSLCTIYIINKCWVCLTVILILLS